MKRFLTVFAVTALMATTVLADHMPNPVAGQERNEKVWLCKTVDDAKLWYSTQSFKDQGQSTLVWNQHMKEVVKQKRCVFQKLKYTVDKVLKITDAPMARRDGWGELQTFYLIQIKSPKGTTFYLSTS